MKGTNNRRFSKGWLTGVILGVASSAILVYAASVTIPNTFNSGDTISSSQMNANFQAIADALNTCSGNDATDIMVKAGALCVDKYEASVWDGLSGGTQITGTLPCSINGNDCSKTDNTGASNSNALYARSVANVAPAATITWFQAQQACANSGKRLLTNAEWQMAAAGTPDTGNIDDGSTNCVTLTSFANTGARSACISNWQVNDMLGNYWEWVADWIQNNEDVDGGSTTSPTFFSDGIFGIDEASPSTDRFPAALIRGAGGIPAGVFALSAEFGPSTAAFNIGFRCAR